MKKIILNSFYLFIILNSFSVFSQRNIAWVHGLGGDSSFWQHYNTIFDNERNINSLRTSYNTSNGLDFAANQVTSSMITKYGANSNNSLNIGIGHSMGGLMLRNSDRLNSVGNKKFGGIITVCSPNNGAPIANSVQNGSVTSAGQIACTRLTAGPNAQITAIPFSGLLCNKFITNSLFDSFISPTTANDIKTGSTIVNSINNAASTTPLINISAVENSPVHWRLMGSLSGNSDQSLVDTANTVRGIYDGFYKVNIGLSIVYGVGGFFNPFLWIKAAFFYHAGCEWKKGRDWIDDSENVWCSLIKTTLIQQESYWVEEWVPCAYPPAPVIPDRSVDPNCGEFVWKQRTRPISVIYPSDGLLPKYTQEIASLPPEYKFTIVGANHIEVQNMTNGTSDKTATVLKFIFDKNWYFKTP